MKWLPLFFCLTACTVVVEAVQDEPTISEVCNGGKCMRCYTYTAKTICAK